MRKRTQTVEYKFKVGDRVKMGSNHPEYHVPVGTEGTVVDTYPEDDGFGYQVKFDHRTTYAMREGEIELVALNHKDETLGRWVVETRFGAQSVLVEYAPCKYRWENSDTNPMFTLHYYKQHHTVTELHLAEGDTMMDADKALEITKEEMELCRAFDEAVAQAKAMTDVPLDTALELVALRRGQRRVFDYYVQVKNRKPYRAPEVPKEGDYVRLTLRDGSTQAGKATYVKDNSDANWPNQAVSLDHRFTGYIYDSYQPDAMDNHTVVKVEKIQRPYTPPVAPKVGDYVRLTMADGSTDMGEVSSTKGLPNEVYVEVSHERRWIPLDQEKHDQIEEAWGGNHVIIVKVEKIQRPWKVGDVVPAGTVVGKRWLGRGIYSTDSLAFCTFKSNNLSFNTDRKIEWIED